MQLPQTVKPGRLLRVPVAGYVPGSRVRVQWGREFSSPRNCCVSPVYPAQNRPGLKIGDDGRATLRLRVPRRYANCVTVRCSSPDWARFRAGQRIYLFVYDDDATGRDTARVR